MPGRGRADLRYEVNLRAAPTQPYFVRLARPVLLTGEDRDAIDAAAASNLNPAGWAAFARTLRGRAEATVTSVRRAGGDLFGFCC